MVGKKEMEKFECNVKKFYDVGSRTFISKLSNIGNDETFYLHVLRFYMPDIVRKTYERHNLGPAIFSMQGFERRNKESQNIMRRFTSHGNKNIVRTNMLRLYDLFLWGNNAY